MKMAVKMMEGMSAEDMERMTEMAATLGAGGGDPGAGGAPGAGFDPSTLNMADLRRRMGDPAMLRTMQGALKGMDPESLAAIMRQSGRDVTPEQAAKMVDSMGSVSGARGGGRGQHGRRLRARPQDWCWCRLATDSPRHTPRLPPLLLPADSQLELIARVVGWLNAVMDAFQGARAWLVARPAVLAALAVLLLALLLRWLGWV